MVYNTRLPVPIATAVRKAGVRIAPRDRDGFFDQTVSLLRLEYAPPWSVSPNFERAVGRGRARPSSRILRARADGQLPFGGLTRPYDQTLKLFLKAVALDGRKHCA